MSAQREFDLKSQVKTTFKKRSMSSKEKKVNASAMVAPSGKKWRNNYGFYQSKIKSFQSLVSEISSDMIDDVGKL